mmetsp:Transcript_14454/g.24675  ORF Transcript_14454/g.24675 Transcript_14454/m.24675 type:complete len:167 (+) Transcript_14454:604-1104(+)
MMRKNLERVITAILNKSPALSYTQGYNDFISVFLLTLDTNLAFHCGSIASVHMLRDFLNAKFDLGVLPALDFAAKLIELLDKELFELVEKMGGQPVFALSWIISWFAHDISNFDDVQLIFDACLATHPLFCVYLSVAQVLLFKERLVACDMPEMAFYMVFKEVKEE